MISRTLQLYLRAEALDPFTWTRYVSGSTWDRPIDMMTWSQTLLRDVRDPLQAVTSDPVDVAIGMLLVAYGELQAVTATPVAIRGTNGSAPHPGPRTLVPPPTAEVARAILRAAMVACEARPRWAKAIVTGRRAMLDLLGAVARRIESSPYVLDVGDAWVTYNINTSIRDYYSPSVFEPAAIAIIEAGVVRMPRWRRLSRFEFPEVSRDSRSHSEAKARRWVYGDEFAFPVEDTIERVKTLPRHVGQSVLATLRRRCLSEQEWDDRWLASGVVEGLRQAVADASGHNERTRRRARTRVLRAFSAFATTWFTHTCTENVRRHQAISWPKENLAGEPQAITRAELAATPSPSLTTIRSVRDDLARRIQARRDSSAAIAAAHQEWIDAHEAYLVASGQVVPTAITGAA